MPSADPITLFLEAVGRAQAKQVDTTPVTLATADAHGRPSARMVLLRGADARGFAFFTNYTSRKARELTENPHAALCFHWPTLEEQIRIEGSSRTCLRSGVGRVLLRPAARQPDWRVGVGPEPGARLARHLDQRYEETERRFAGRPGDPPSLLGRLPPDPGAHGVLAGTRRVDSTIGSCSSGKVAPGGRSGCTRDEPRIIPAFRPDPTRRNAAAAASGAA